LDQILIYGKMIMDSDSGDDKIYEIQSLINNNSETIIRLLELSHCEDWSIRHLAIERLGEFGGEYHFTESINRIRQGLSDSSGLVRSTCILVLGDWQDNESLEQIVEFLVDEDWIVRIAAAEAVGNIGDSSKAEILEQLLETIEDDNERVFFYLGLVLLDQTQWVTQILDSLNSNCYLTRCAAANSLISCVTEQNRAVILESLKQALAKEETRAAYSSIEGAIKTLEEET
jgi:HEAT repeat protein